MQNNPLLNKLPKTKYNPDVLNKFEQVKNARSSLVVEKINPRFDVVKEVDKGINKELVAKSRQQQDSNFSKIFSKENFMRNKLLFDNRQQEVARICNEMKVEDSTFANLKNTYK